MRVSTIGCRKVRLPAVHQADWPFQYKGMEKEFTDPAPYYYSGSGQFYSPHIWPAGNSSIRSASIGSVGGFTRTTTLSTLD
jgi:hypothetical protein